MQLQLSFLKSLWSGTLLKFIRKVGFISRSPVSTCFIAFKELQWEFETCVVLKLE